MAEEDDQSQEGGRAQEGMMPMAKRPMRAQMIMMRKVEMAMRMTKGQTLP